MGLIRVDHGRIVVLVAPPDVSTETVDEIAAEIGICLDTQTALETIYIDLHNAQNVDDSLLHAVQVWARALDEEGILLRLRRPDPELRAVLRDTYLSHLIEGY